ncbi:MAG: hypothetical protein HC899_11035 [Leptolyngbyaceae cyanobacterium SM1_4_3]|nr:hypothetical protein [Leptolyngbyaceae cyanobacterium SM1_4_3]
MAVTLVWVLDDSLKFFSKLHTFIILAGVVFGGLGLGWLVGAGLRLMGIELPAVE